MQDDTVRLSLADAFQGAWEKCFTVAGFGVCVGFSASGSGTIKFTLTLVIAGTRHEWGYEIDGNRCLEAGYGPLSVEACISEWDIESHSATFRLTLIAKAFWSKWTLFNDKITIPLPSAEEIEALESLSAEAPQELAPVLALLIANEPPREVPPGYFSGEAVGGCTCSKGA